MRGMKRMRGIRVGMIRMRGIRVGDDGNVWNQGGDAGNQGENLRIGVEVMNKKFGEG